MCATGELMTTVVDARVREKREREYFVDWGDERQEENESVAQS